MTNQKTVVFLPVLILGLSATSAQDCAKQASIDTFRAQIKADQDSIRKLGLGITTRDLEDASDIAEEGRKKAMLAAALSLIDGFLNAPEGALGTKSIANYQLKNGLGSLGTGQVNALIGRIRAQGGVKQALIPAIRKLSQISGKTSSLEYLNALSRAVKTLKSTAELGDSENSLEEAEALFGLAAAVAGEGDLAVSLASAIVNSAKNETQIYLMAKTVGQLTSTNEAQLRALQVLSTKLQGDVQSLQGAKNELAACNGSVSPANDLVPISSTKNYTWWDYQPDGAQITLKVPGAQGLAIHWLGGHTLYNAGGEYLSVCGLEADIRNQLGHRVNDYIQGRIYPEYAFKPEQPKCCPAA